MILCDFCCCWCRETVAFRLLIFFFRFYGLLQPFFFLLLLFNLYLGHKKEPTFKRLEHHNEEKKNTNRVQNAVWTQGRKTCRKQKQHQQQQRTKAINEWNYRFNFLLHSWWADEHLSFSLFASLCPSRRSVLFSLNALVYTNKKRFKCMHGK